MKENNTSEITVANSHNKKPTYSDIVRGKETTVAINTEVKRTENVDQ